MRFSPPNYTPAPNELFDEWLPKLGMGELKVLMVILRKTFGWHKVRDRISLSQLETITGLERRHVSKGIKGLIQKNLISKTVEGKKGEQVTYYELIIIDNSNNSYQCPKDAPPSVLKTPTKETLTKEIKENIIKEKESKKRKKKEPAQPIDRGDGIFTTELEHETLIEKLGTEDKVKERYKEIGIWKNRAGITGGNDYRLSSKWIDNKASNLPKDQLSHDQIKKDRETVGKAFSGVSKEELELLGEGPAEITVRIPRTGEVTAIYFGKPHTKDMINNVLRKLGRMPISDQ